MDKENCSHIKVIPVFDLEDSKSLSSEEVKRKYPRFSGICPDCGCNVILYESFEHYIAGDW
jgi:hypothetical protein